MSPNESPEKLADGKTTRKMEESTREWEIVVEPGRYVCVDLEQANFVQITSIHLVSVQGGPSLLDFNAQFQKKDLNCEVYLGFNSRLREDEVIVQLSSHSQREAKVDKKVEENFCLGHSGFSAVCFKGRTNKPAPDEWKSQWPLSTIITAKILSKLDNTMEVAKAECICKDFSLAGQTGYPYEHINLTGNTEVEDLTAIMCMKRSHGCLSSFAIGFLLSGAQYTTRFLEPLTHIGFGVTKLVLDDLQKVSSSDLEPVFAGCPKLTELELKYAGLLLQRSLMQVIGRNCKMLTRFVYSATPTETFHILSADDIKPFIENCTRVEYLSLKRVDIDDDVLNMITEGLKNSLRSLILSRSLTGIGLFLEEFPVGQIPLQVLVLDACFSVQEFAVVNFFQRLREDKCYLPNLTQLTVISKAPVDGEHNLQERLENGFDENLNVVTLNAVRPEIQVQAEYLSNSREDRLHNGYGVEEGERALVSYLNREMLFSDFMYKGDEELSHKDSVEMLASNERDFIGAWPSRQHVRFRSRKKFIHW